MPLHICCNGLLLLSLLPATSHVFSFYGVFPCSHCLIRLLPLLFLLLFVIIYIYVNVSRRLYNRILWMDT
ncbi:uncharacterized protein BX664DRAFT_337296 [Halteromyces radiatus]|uniref:uncharacterized protein n=1 Tax=Halteromyces radiatus TaxID=101107 RepID=UPI0022201EE6|nr:uncharacterized protein BX664DRAFT_337296 [Halteromyces radiatus]KAI8084578.1 hypothetical protein BX664DRAFT_337296 [Halteromyces radiatus]